MNKRLKQTLERVFTSAILSCCDATMAWALWSVLSKHVITWPEWWAICMVGLGVIRTSKIMEEP